MIPQRPKILVVDDSPANLMMLANALDSEFSFQLVTSGQAACEMAAKAPPELILLDVMMPGMDGYETCRRFKADPQLAAIPIIFVTALNDSGSQLLGLELGAADYLHKPVNIDIARQRILNLLERERLRHEVEAQRNSLEELVAARTAELVRARDDAEAANRSKTIFLANLSHEFRTPLNIILGMNDLIRRQADDETLRKRSEQVQDAARHLLAMVNDLLLVARSDQEPENDQASAFSVSHLIAALDEQFAPATVAKGLALRHEIDPYLPATLIGAEPRIRQILKNLLSNAVKFSNHGTITIRVVVEEAIDSQHLVTFSVTDQGIGIPKSQLQNIFDSFTQVDASSTRKQGGVGIGLAINRYLADQIGGRIGVESSEGKGSCFWLTVRLANASPGAALRLKPAPSVAPPGAAPAAPASQTPAASDRAKHQHVLQHLLAALARDDFASIALWEDAQAHLAPLLGEDLTKISQALEQFAFDEAHRLLQAASPLNPAPLAP